MKEAVLVDELSRTKEMKELKRFFFSRLAVLEDEVVDRYNPSRVYLHQPLLLPSSHTVLYF